MNTERRPEDVDPDAPEENDAAPVPPDEAPDDKNGVDETSEESFPASDPPPY